MHPSSKNLPASLLSAIRKDAARFRNADDGDKSITVASYNVHKCIGVDGKFDPERTTRVISEINADIIALQEADERFGNRAGLLDLHLLERNANLFPVLTPTKVGSHGWHGNVLLIRNGIVHQVRRLSLPGIEPRGAVVVDVEVRGVSLRIIAAHLGLFRHSRSSQATALLEAAHGERPTLLMGDLNEWRVKRRSALMHLSPHFGPVEAALPSFPSRFPLLALDRILASPHHMISSIEIHDSALARIASDHLPIKAQLNLAAAQG